MYGDVPYDVGTYILDERDGAIGIVCDKTPFPPDINPKFIKWIKWFGTTKDTKPYLTEPKCRKMSDEELILLRLEGALDVNRL